MTTPSELYINGVRKQFKNYYAAWLPDTNFELGDVGKLKGNLFTKETSLKNLGITFKKRRGPDSTGLIEYVSESGVTRVFKAAGQTNSKLPGIPDIEAGIGIEFSEEGAFIVEAQDTYDFTIEDLIQLEEDIRRAFIENRWEPDFVVITRLLSATFATILISNTSKSSIEFSAGGDIPIKGISLGNVNNNLITRSQTGQMLKIVGAKKVTPFFQLAQLKPKKWLFNSPILNAATSHLLPSSLITFITDRQNPLVASSIYLDILDDTDAEWWLK
jgi:hypothetical protein